MSLPSQNEYAQAAKKTLEGVEHHLDDLDKNLADAAKNSKMIRHDCRQARQHLGSIAAVAAPCVAVLVLIAYAGPHNHLSDGIRLANERQPQQAIAAFEKHLSLKDDPFALQELAYLYYQQNRPGNALDACDKLIAGGNFLGRAHYVKGLVARKQGQNETAALEFRKAAAHGEELATRQLTSRQDKPRTK